MPECPVCAFDNPPSADVCGECGAPLTSAVPAPEPFTPGLAGGGGQIPERPVSSGRAAKADAGRVASGRDSRGATPPRKKGANLALEPSELTVDPGSAVTVTVTVHNLGDQVEQFVLSVNGPGGGFATADPADLHMLPDKKQTSVLRFTPVRDPRQPAGPQPFQVVARSTVNADVVARASGVVTVGGFAELTADLEPEVTRGLRPGTHRLELVNAGNEPTAVEVELHDESGELVFDPPAMDGRLEPGAREERSFRVVGPRAWFGRTAPFPFTLTVASTGAKQPLQLRAVRRQVPRFPWWIPTVALALVGIAVAVVALWPDSAKPPPNRVPNVALQEQAASEALLKERGYQPIAIPTSDTEVPSGKSIKTEPPVGTPVERGESVSLFVSRGPCPAEGCPPPAVPNVVGLPIADALRHMDDAGLIGQPVPPPGGDPAVGTVTDTRPGPGQPVGEDHRVALTIASVTSAAASSAASSASAAASSAAAASAPSSVSGPPSTSGSPPSASPSSSGSTAPVKVKVKVPSVKGSTLSIAAEALKVAGFAVTTTQRHTNAAARDVVLDSDPAEAQELAKGDAVTLTVAAPTHLDLNPVIDDADWTAGDAKLAFPTSEDNPPVARWKPVSAGTSGDLVTQPAPGSTLAARMTLPDAVIPGDHLRAGVRITEGEGDVEIAVVADGKPLPPALTSASALEQVDVDLSPAAGSTDIEITVRALPLPTSSSTSPSTTAPAQVGPDQVVWKDLRVEGVTK